MFLINLFFKKSILQYFLLATLVLASHNALAYKKIDEVVTVVGDDVIFKSELQHKKNLITRSLTSRGQKASKASIENRALELLILEKIQLDLATKANIVINEEELNQSLRNAEKNIRQQGVSISEYLKNQKITQENFAQQIRNSLLIDRLQNAVVNQRIRITEKEIDTFLKSTEGKNWIEPKFHIGHIFLPTTIKNKKRIRKQAQRIYTLLQNPETNFGKIAQKYSKGPNAGKGGDMGILKKEDMPELFSRQVTSLQRGDITPPFSSDAGIHILKVLDRRGAQPVVVTQYETRHILVKVTELFTEEEAKNKIQSLYSRTTSGEDFNALAKEFSEDIGSKLDGGYLDWSIPGKFVKEFEIAMQKTPSGKVSKPFRSQFGWHILKVENSRKKDIFDDVKRNQAANFLRRQRFHDELNIWLQELRENTYVEILI